MSRALKPNIRRTAPPLIETFQTAENFKKAAVYLCS